MSQRPQLSPFNVITDGDMSSVSLVSSVTVIQKLSMISYAVKWTGTSPVGTLAVEVSNDYSQYADGSVHNSGTWTALSFQSNGIIVSSLAVSGNTGNGFIDITQTAAYAMRVKYTKVSGVGTLNVTIAAKVA